MGSVIADLLGKENAAEWNKTSQDYWTKAKKEAFQDLTATAAFIAMGLTSGCVGTALLKEEQKKEEPGYIQNYAVPLVKSLYNHKGKIAGVGILTGLWYKCNREISPEQKRMASEFVQKIKEGSEEATASAMKPIFGNQFPSHTTTTSPTTTTKPSPRSSESMENKYMEDFWENF
jgi:hypothetical protein